jgi:thymidylate kinase
MPDRTVFLRVDPGAAHERGQQRLAEGGEDGSDRFESEGVDFQRTVAAAYDDIAARHPERIAVVDGEGEPAEVHGRVLEALRTHSD